MFEKLQNSIKRIVKCAAIFFAVASIIGCGKKDYGNEFTTAPLSDGGYEIEEVVLECPEISGEYNLLVVADLHLISINDEVLPQSIDEVKARISNFRKEGKGLSSAKRWKKLPTYINNCNSDMVLFAGDMVDFASKENIDLLKTGIDEIINAPILYARADHDISPFYMTSMSQTAYNECLDRQMEVSHYADAFYEDLGEVVILVINNSTGQVTDSGLLVVKEAIEIGKPIVLLTHVPIDSMIDDSLREMSGAMFAGRNLTWGLETEYYRPEDTTKEFLNLVYAEDSLIKEIVCGHLHFEWDGYITENTHEHVYSPAFDGKIGLLRIRGQK